MTDNPEELQKPSRRLRPKNFRGASKKKTRGAKHHVHHSGSRHGTARNEVTYIREVVERVQRTTGEMVDLPTGDVRLYFADGRSVTFEPILAGELKVRGYFGHIMPEAIVQRGVIAGAHRPPDVLHGGGV